MPFKNNYWNRLYNWINEAGNYQTISSSKIDKDTNDMCDNSLSKVITQTQYKGLPLADMDFDGHRITNINDSDIGEDAQAATVRQQFQKYNFYEDESDTSNVIRIRANINRDPMPQTNNDDARLNGMRLFVHIKNANVNDTLMLAIYQPDGITLFSTIAVLNFNNPTGAIGSNRLKADAVVELVFYRGDLGNGIISAFYVKLDTTLYCADSTLSNVTTLNTDLSCIKSYIKYFACKTTSDGTFYTAQIDNLNHMTITISHRQWVQGLRVGTFNFTTDLGTTHGTFKFADTNYTVAYSVDTEDLSCGFMYSSAAESITISFFKNSSNDATNTNGVNIILKGLAVS